MKGPLTQVLEAFSSGAGTFAELVSRTGLSDEVVRASVEHLIRLGRIESEQLRIGCLSGGCGACALRCVSAGLPSKLAGAGVSSSAGYSTNQSSKLAGAGLVRLRVSKPSKPVSQSAA